MMRHRQFCIRPLHASIVLIGVLLAVGGCGSSGGGSGPTPPTLDDAWDQFAARHYVDAVATFHTVLSDDSSLTDAINGLGWSFAFAGSLDSAQFYFERTIARQPTLTDAVAGLSAVLLALGEETGAVDRATAALTQDAAWSFTHQSAVDHEDLHLILAQAYFAQGGTALEHAQAEVDVLDPSNNLDPESPATWGSAPTYTAALLSLIQSIEERVGAEMML